MPGIHTHSPEIRPKDRRARRVARVAVVLAALAVTTIGPGEALAVDVFVSENLYEAWVGCYDRQPALDVAVQQIESGEPLFDAIIASYLGKEPPLTAIVPRSDAETLFAEHVVIPLDPFAEAMSGPVEDATGQSIIGFRVPWADDHVAVATYQSPALADTINFLQSPCVVPLEAKFTVWGLLRPGEILHFSAADSRGEIEHYDWMFSDGTQASGDLVTHVFDEAGDHGVLLTVTNSQGRTDQITKWYGISEPTWDWWVPTLTPAGWAIYAALAAGVIYVFVSALNADG